VLLLFEIVVLNKYKKIYIKKEEKKEKIVILYCYEKNMKKYTKKIYKNIYKKITFEKKYIVL
jgi:hypothetical protein